MADIFEHFTNLIRRRTHFIYIYILILLLMLWSKVVGRLFFFGLITMTLAGVKVDYIYGLQLQNKTSSRKE